MIHGGLNINLRLDDQKIHFSQCCQKYDTDVLGENELLWTSDKLVSLRELNDQNIWGSDCTLCERNEASGLNSFRKSMITKFSERRNLSGPLRIDLLFDLSCNLACRICGPHSSTFWQKQHKDNHIPIYDNYAEKSRVDDVITLLKTLDLSNLEMVQFCGGETLMGNTYWRVAELIASMVPDAKEKLTIGFQTNGTQAIDPRFYETIEKFELVKILISLDGTKDRFNYMRWPADWNQVADNILQMRQNLPVNVMFLFEETISTLNLFYHDEVGNWINDNFSDNRLGDPVNHAKHLVMHDLLDVSNITQEYKDAIDHLEIKNLIPNNWQENPQKIQEMIADIEKFDKIRNQNWRNTFPEVAEFYSKYIR
jgi:pyruvate-formate lyase-activating enzyme